MIDERIETCSVLLEDDLTEVPELKTLSTLSGSFGREHVTLQSRRYLVRDLFDRIAPRYDFMNDLMSFGMHRLWKHAAASTAIHAALPVSGPLIDLAGGTGDLSRLCKAGLPDRCIINIDASPGMINMAARHPGNGGITLVVAEAEQLPIPDNSVAAVMLAFGLRNMTEPRRALCETFRVLKPGGNLIVLEFSTPRAWLVPFYEFYSRLVIPALGTVVAGDRRAYSYLVESIRQFPGVEALNCELRNAGFKKLTVRRLSFGIAALHRAEKA
jgi:demethylmenaquinone methyltransferase / 2-methoxy-6-polyprenyl-1,4-benzoquinol methylase